MPSGETITRFFSLFILVKLLTRFHVDRRDESGQIDAGEGKLWWSSPLVIDKSIGCASDGPDWLTDCRSILLSSFVDGKEKSFDQAKWPKILTVTLLSLTIQRNHDRVKKRERKSEFGGEPRWLWLAVKQ